MVTSRFPTCIENDVVAIKNVIVHEASAVSEQAQLARKLYEVGKAEASRTKALKRIVYLSLLNLGSYLVVVVLKYPRHRPALGRQALFCLLAILSWIHVSRMQDGIFSDSL